MSNKPHLEDLEKWMNHFFDARAVPRKAIQWSGLKLGLLFGVGLFVYCSPARSYRCARSSSTSVRTRNMCALIAGTFRTIKKENGFDHRNELLFQSSICRSRGISIFLDHWSSKALIITICKCWRTAVRSHWPVLVRKRKGWRRSAAATTTRIPFCRPYSRLKYSSPLSQNGVYHQRFEHVFLEVSE